MQTGPALRESLVALITGVWYILVYGTSALVLLAARRPAGWRCRSSLWFVGYVGAAALVRAAHARPLEGGVGGALDADRPHRRQLHQHPDREAVRPRARRGRLCARGASTSTPGCFHSSLRLNTLFSFCLSTLNALLVTGTGGARDRGCGSQRQGRGRHRRDGAAADLADRQRRRLGRASRSPTIFENIGVVQEGMMTIARPIALTDRAGRRRARGAARRDRVRGRALRLWPRERR